jgi:neurotransmitter:Na+ symporter, NSS family
MMLVMLGMAVGTGNIWRFPRIAATNDGGTFLIPWVMFLLLWSIPLILTEFALGKGMRAGPVSAIGKLIGKKHRWMGLWIAFTATAIMFYYSVVTGWCLRFVIAAVAGEIPSEVPGAFWSGFEGSWQAVATHLTMISVAVALVMKGVKGIERAGRILLPLLLVMLVVLMVRALTLPNAHLGLNFLFSVNWAGLTNSEVWLQAMTQNAWDTGAGWGLIVCYAIYTRTKEDTNLNAFMLGFGNNSISLMAGIIVLCTIFSINPAASSEIVGSGNNGLTFIWVPQLFATMPGGNIFLVVFFVALMFAAFTSLVSMVELSTRVLIDWKLSRKRAILVVGAAGALFGLPSALSPDVFNNQDAVWGIGLMLSGLFFAIAVLKFGAAKFRKMYMNTEGSDLHIGKWWDYVMVFVVVEAIALLTWWLSQTISNEGLLASLNPWSAWSLGTVLLQWGVALLAFLSWNHFANKRGDPA